MAAFDHYAATHELIRQLTEQGAVGWARKLEDALASGSTGTEILMALRWNLKELKRSKAISCGQTRELANQLLRELEAQLSRPRPTA
jgi:hypothetical protein